MIQAMEPSPFWWNGRERRLSHWFVLGSLLLHVGLFAMFFHGFPISSGSDVTPSPPLMVTILDPDAVKDLSIGPTTNLPPKPRNLDPAPRSRPVAPAPLAPTAPHAAGRSGAQSPANEREGFSETVLPTISGRDSAPGAPDANAPALSEPPSAPGLPFVSREEIDRMAGLYTDQSRSPKEPYTVNTEDLQYLSYIAQIARTLELVWQYPREAGDRGQQGVTVLKVLIRDDGTLDGVQMVRSSGYPMLDGEAQRAIKLIAPYPPLPKVWHRAKWELTISFTYQLFGVAVSVI
jgi:TonB family protein